MQVVNNEIIHSSYLTMASREIDIGFLKELSLIVYQEISPLIGTEKGAKKLKRGAGGDISMEIDVVAEKTIIGHLENNRIEILLISEETGEKFIGNQNNI